MSYLVMARKWRPQTFEDLVGQEHVSKTLKRAIETNRIAHAYLFTGTRGVGKTTAARIFAKALNCEKGPTSTPCGVCSSCKEIVAGTGTDVVEIDGASNRGIDDIRAIQENVRYTSMRGKYRIFIIDEVHMVTKQAFNAFLKTLEEPPPNVVFIFATTEPVNVPQTILSRCQRYDFRRIPFDKIKGHIKYICEEDNIDMEDGVLNIIAKKAEGSMRDGLSLFDQIISSAQEGGITLENTREILGLLGQDSYIDLLKAIANKDISRCMVVVDKVFYGGYSTTDFIVELGEQIRYLLFAKTPDLLKEVDTGIPSNVIEIYKEIAQHFSDGDLIRMANWVNNLSQSVRRSNYPRFEIEICLLKMIHVESTVLISDIIGKYKTQPTSVGVSEPRKKEAPVLEYSSPVQEEQPPKEERIVSSLEQKKEVVTEEQPPLPPPPLEQMDNSSNTEISSDDSFSWSNFLDEIMQKKQSIGTFISLARVISIDSSVIKLEFPSEQGFAMKLVQNEIKFMESVIKEMSGKSLRLEMSLAQSIKAHDEDIKKKESVKMDKKILKKEEIPFDEAAKEEPIMNKLVDMFNGEVIL